MDGEEGHLRFSALIEFAQFVKAQAHIVSTHPSLVFQQAANQPDWTAPARAARVRTVTRPWLRLINKNAFSTCMMTLAGHTAKVNAFAISPDGKRLLSASQDSSLKLWNLETGSELLTFGGHLGAVNSCSFSPTGLLIVSASSDKTLKLWDAATGAVLATLVGHEDKVNDCAFSRDDRYIISASDDKTLMLWDTLSLKSIRSMIGHQRNANCCVFSPDGTRIASGSDDCTIRIWNGATGVELLVLIGEHPWYSKMGPVNSLAFSRDGTRIISGGVASIDRLDLRLWDARTGRELAIIAGNTDGSVIWPSRGTVTLKEAWTDKNMGTRPWHLGDVTACDFSPDGKNIISASKDGTLILWDILPSKLGQFIEAAGKVLGKYTGHGGAVLDCAFTADGCKVISCSADCTLRIWDVCANASKLASGHAGQVNSCVFSPNGSEILTASDDGTLKVWDAATGEEIATLTSSRSSEITSASYSPDMKWIISGRGSSLEIWDRLHKRLKQELDDRCVNDCAYSPDGTLILSASDSLKLWDSKNGKLLTVLSGHANKIAACAFSPDGTRILSASWDNTLKLWDVGSGKHLLTWDDTLKLWDAGGRKHLVSFSDLYSRVGGCGFSPDGRTILAGSLNIKLHDATTGKELLCFSDTVRACRFSPDGLSVLSCDYANTLSLWDAKDGSEICKSWIGNIHSVGWHPNGRSIVVGDRAGQVYILHLENVMTAPPILTAWAAGKESDIAFACPHCKVWSTTYATKLGTQLPCTGCQRQVRLNSFTIKADWHPIAKNWESEPEELGNENELKEHTSIKVIESLVKNPRDRESTLEPIGLPSPSKKLLKNSQRRILESGNARIRIGKNAPCPCGSGKKYKKCCGQ